MQEELDTGCVRDPSLVAQWFGPSQVQEYTSIPTRSRRSSLISTNLKLCIAHTLGERFLSTQI